MTTKEKKAKLYRPNLTNVNGTEFAELLSDLAGENGKVFEFNDNKLIAKVRRRDDCWIIVLQDLKKDELPKIADSANGTDEQNLDIPDGKMLSYKNIFVYKEGSNMLVGIALYGCPQIGKLRFCLESTLKSKCGDDALLRISLVFKHDLVERIRNCHTVTFAEFSSFDYDGESISEARLNMYKEYLGGHNYEKITKVKGKKGENIKNILQPILDDVISHRDDDSIPVGIKMRMDGEDVDFEKYYKTFPVNVEMDPDNEKYVDYDDLAKKLEDLVSQYSEEEA